MIWSTTAVSTSLRRRRICFRRFRFRDLAAGAFLLAAVLGASGLLLELGRGRALAADREEDLPRRQGEVKDILQDVTRRMDRLAETLQPAQPEDARRLREAAERLRTQGIDRQLEEISRLLSRQNFIEAVGRQDRAIEELDKIIALLEEARFKESDARSKADANEEARRALQEIEGRQERLLGETRELIEKIAGRDLLKRIQQDLAQLASDQTALNEGRDPDTLDPEGTSSDQAALDRALERIAKILRGEEGIIQRTEGLEGKVSPAAPVKESLSKLEDLLSRAEALESGAAGAKEEPSGSREGSEKKLENGKRSDGAREKSPEPTEGSKDGGAQALRSAEDLAGGLDGLKREIAQRPLPEEAKEAIAKELETGADEARRALGQAGAEEERARQAGKSASTGLRKARDALARAVQKIEDANARETAPVVQDQGMLQEETNQAADGLKKDSGESSSEAARSALDRGSEALRSAADAMGRLAESLQGGESQAAREAGAEAKKALEEAMSAVGQGRKDLENRTGDQKRADVQNKIGGKADAARRRVDGLRQREGAKDKDRASNLEEAAKALSEATRSMRGAAGSRRRGDSNAAQKEGEEAQQKLGLARKKLSEVEKATPPPEPPRRQAKEQDELARMTRQVAKNLTGGSQAGQEEAGNVSSAADSMDGASQDLSKDDAGAAEKKQKDALEKLRGSRKSLEEEAQKLAQLNREREVISMLQELTKLKDGEESILSETVQLNSQRQPDESRRQRLLVRDSAEKLSRAQDALADQVDKLNEKLRDELSRVFSFVLKNVGADMRQARDAMKDLELGSSTQFLQKEAIGGLTQLIEALKSELAQLKEGGSGGGGAPPSRLVPLVAELRMLKEMQVDVYGKTRGLEDVRSASKGKLAEAWERSLERLLQKQGSVSRLTGQILEDFEKLRKTGEERGTAPGESEEKSDEKPGNP